MTEERLSFQAEVSRLLDIVARSLYSEREVFLRELISNASDACDKRRHAALTEPGLGAPGGGYEIRLIVDKDMRTLTVADNGVGMNRDDLIAYLGSIARSGSAQFLAQASGDAKGELSLIGQFGVGFYSAFMVADRVRVLTRKAGESQSWAWESDGKGEYVVAAVDDALDGTRVVLHLREDAGEYLDESRLRQIVRRHSDHVAIPIRLGEGAEAEALNAASALWTRPKAEVTEEQHREFLHHVGGFGSPWLTLHWRAEGVLEYAALLYVPDLKPFDLFDPARRHGVKLYVRRVFVADAPEGLLPGWLRFLRGVVDSEDLPLNVSRELLQTTPMLAKIRQGLVKRALSELTKKAESDAEGYAAFWENFGAVLKEGLYEDPAHRDELLKLARFRSTASDDPVSLADYVGRMKEGQEAIFVISGDDAEALARSPQLEGFRAKGVEALLLTDPVDEFWLPAVAAFDGKPFRSVTRGGADLAKIKGGEAEKSPEDAARTERAASLAGLFKAALGDAVKDVRPSERLTDSAACLVAEDGDMDMHLERLLRQHQQLERAYARVLEINPGHPLIVRAAELAGEEGRGAALDDLAWLLFDQARIQEGDPPRDPVAFARRLAAALERGLTAPMTVNAEPCNT